MMMKNIVHVVGLSMCLGFGLHAMQGGPSDFKFKIHENIFKSLKDGKLGSVCFLYQGQGNSVWNGLIELNEKLKEESSADGVRAVLKKYIDEKVSSSTLADNFKEALKEVLNKEIKRCDEIEAAEKSQKEEEESLKGLSGKKEEDSISHSSSVDPDTDEPASNKDTHNKDNHNQSAWKKRLAITAAVVAACGLVIGVLSKLYEYHTTQETDGFWAKMRSGIKSDLRSLKSWVFGCNEDDFE